jgi:hypothetical protein
VEIQGLLQPSNATSTKPTGLRDFVDAYNFARRLKTLGGLTPYESVYPLQQSPGLNI